MNLITKNPRVTEKLDKIAIIDSDSLLYQVSYPGKDENYITLPDYTEKDYEMVEGKLGELVHSVLNSIEERYNITKHYLCVKGKNNFRKEIYPDYKANRPPSPPIIGHLAKYLVDNFGAIEADGFEADDLVFTISESIGHQGVIACMDKDLYQIPSIFYNYGKAEWDIVDEKRARYNLAIQMITGDATDGINFTRGWGPKKAEKLINPDMSEYQYIKTIFPIYQVLWKDRAKEIMRLSYNLLKLHKIVA